MTDASQSRPRLVIDIVSDPVCPWCYVGFKAFQLARDRISSEFQVLPRIRAYMLNPDTPADGVDRVAYYEKKFPDADQRETMLMQLKAAALGAGFKFDPSIPKHLPNTAKAHQLIRLSHFDGAQERLVENLYGAYWDEGIDIGDEDALVTIAEQTGLDGDNALRDLQDPKSKNTVLAEAEAFRRAGVSGVPTFIINERDGFSGAVPPDRMAEAFRTAAKDLHRRMN